MDQQRQFDTIMDVVRCIPPGRVMSYGQVGREAGGISARVTGWAMANASGIDVPWQRVVAADGRLSIGSRDEALKNLQRSLLEQEGVRFLDNGRVDMQSYQSGSGEFKKQNDPQGAMLLEE